MIKKTAYEKPQMVVLGEVRKLTKGQADGAVTDGAYDVCQVPLFS